MRVLLISANTERFNFVALPWGLACVATAATQAGHQVRLLDMLNEQDPDTALATAIRELEPEVIGISVRNIDDQNSQNPSFLLEKVRELVRRCRAMSQAPIVLGGAGYSIFPREALDYLGADLGIRCEGERSFSLLLERLEAGDDPSDVPGIYVRGEGFGAEGCLAGSLDDLPLPSDDLLAGWTPDDGLWLPLQGRRGCAMDCSYCSTAAIEGRAVRRREVKLVAGYMKRCVEAGFQRIWFVDNNFNVPRSYALDLCRQIGELELEVQWRCILNPQGVDEELVEAMAGAGCVEVSLGFESGSEEVLTRMNKRFGPKEIRGAAELLGDRGIRRMGFLLLGGPGETRDTAVRSLEFADSLGLEGMRVTAGIRIYPGTELARIAEEEGMVDPGESLLRPRFYIARGLEEWLPRVVEEWGRQREGWIV